MVFLKLDSAKLFYTLGLNPADIGTYAKCGITLKQSVKGLEFYHSGDFIARIAIGAGLINQIMNGTSSSATKQALVDKILAVKVEYLDVYLFKGLAMQVTYQYSSYTPPAAAEELIKGVVEEQLGKQLAGIISSPPPIKLDAPAIPVEYGAKKATAPLPLDKCDVMYQPTTGASEGSVYHVVALYKTLRVSARYKGSMISIRVMGDLEAHKSRLISAGVSWDATKKSHGYQSLHVKCPEVTQAAKVIGGFLAALSLRFSTPVPVISKFASMGN